MSTGAMVVRVNVRPLKERIEFARRRIPGARVEAMRMSFRTAMRAVLAVSPRDTMRYSRAWAMAGNQAGIGPFPVPEVRKSRFAEQWADRLAVQVVERWKELQVARMAVDKTERSLRSAEATIAQGRRSSAMQLRLRELRTRLTKLRKWGEDADDRHRRSRTELDLYMASGGQGVLIFGKTRTRSGRPRLTTVRAKVYGGVGRAEHTPERSTIMVSNREPHARIVEFKKRLAQKAAALLRQLGITTGRKAILASMNAGAPR